MKRPFLFVFLVTAFFHATLFSYLFATHYQNREATDGSQYQLLADNLLAGHGFSEQASPPYKPDTIRTPIYPYFLAAIKSVTGSFDSSLFISMLLGLTIPLAGMLIMRLLSDRPGLLLASGLALAFDPHVFMYSFIYGSEAIFLPLVAWGMVLTLYTLFRPKPLWFAGLAGLLMGLAILTRPIVQFIPFLFLGFVIVQMYRFHERRRFLAKTTVSFLFGIFIIISPWLMRSYTLFHTFDFSNVGWFNMYTRVAATTYAIHAHQDYPSTRLEFLERLYQKGYVDHHPVEEMDVHGYEFKPIFKKETWLTIRQYPFGFLVSQVSAFFTVISQDLTMQYAKGIGFISFPYPSFAPFEKLAQEGLLATTRAVWNILSVPIVVSIVGRVIWFLLFILSLLALILAWKKKRPMFALSLFLVLFELLIVALSLNAAAQASARYRAQFIFVEIPLAIFCLSLLRRRESLVDGPACPICGGKNEIHLRGTKYGHDIYRCADCSAQFIAPMPSEESVQAFYSSEYFFGGHPSGGYANYDEDKRATADSLNGFLVRLEAHQPARGNLLDMGAATGIFLEFAKVRGWQVFGHELSETAASIGRQRGIPMTSGSLQADHYPVNSFSVVTMLDVIEHLRDPVNEMILIGQLVAPGGYLLINTPDAGSWLARLFGLRWHAVTPPEHLILFQRKTVRRLLGGLGFDIMCEENLSKTFRLSYIFHTLDHNLPWIMWRKLAIWFEQHSRWNKAIPLPLRDNMVIIARKRF